ncbi:MAG: hypothetical protein E7455_04755 [Ruminococcaceae bacterium]|nr:hypothetical protein [Oscillospiraceae bacterium]
MRDENAVLEELQQEETSLMEESVEEQAQEEAAEIVPETEEQPQEEPTEEQESEPSSEENPSEEAESSDDASEATDKKALPYHERYYLKYHDGKRSTPMDLDGTRSFLQVLGFDGGELRKAREGKDCAENFRNAEKNRNNQMYCSYCGTEIAGVEFYRLPDGRMRCTTCSSTVVKDKAEVEALCKRVIENMDNFFGATIDVPVSIEVLDERKLKKKVGVPLGTRDSQSMLILGVAINKKKKYSIILENGAPRISLLATFAHELTHIWQYTHWDNNPRLAQCDKNKRLLIYEGMAKWVEIQYLYLVGETNVAKREEYITRNRQDEYGVGFCMYEDKYPLSREAMSCDDTPFTLDRYPLD